MSVCCCVLNRFVLAGIYSSSRTPSDEEKIAKRTPTIVTPPPLTYLQGKLIHSIISLSNKANELFLSFLNFNFFF